MQGEKLSGARLDAALGGEAILGRRVEVHDQVESTNDLAALRGSQGEAEGLVVIAESQDSGRGRRGAKWVSESGRDLLFSILLRPKGRPDSWPWLVHGAAVGVARVVEAVCGVPVGIKWPNDVYLPGNRKVCGILMETVVGSGSKGTGHAVLGIGLNVNSGNFPAELGQTAGSISEVLGGEVVDRERLLVSVLQELEAIYLGGEGVRGSVIEEAERRSVLHGRSIAVGEGARRVEGQFLGLDEGGGLRLRIEEGRERVFGGAEHVELVD